MTLEEKVERLETLVLKNFRIISAYSALFDEMKGGLESLKFISSDVEEYWHFLTDDEERKAEELGEESYKRYKRENIWKRED